MNDLFPSRKRIREEEEDDLQQYAPDTKVSAANSPHLEIALLTQNSRDQLYPSVPHPTPDISVPFLSHEAGPPPSSHKLLPPQTLRKKRTRPLSNLQIKPTKIIYQTSTPAPLIKETRFWTQIWI